MIRRANWRSLLMSTKLGQGRYKATVPGVIECPNVTVVEAGLSGVSKQTLQLARPLLEKLGNGGKALLNNRPGSEIAERAQRNR